MTEWVIVTPEIMRVVDVESLSVLLSRIPNPDSIIAIYRTPEAMDRAAGITICKAVWENIIMPILARARW